jgi:hypothetical protein
MIYLSQFFKLPAIPCLNSGDTHQPSTVTMAFRTASFLFFPLNTTLSSPFNTLYAMVASTRYYSQHTVRKQQWRGHGVVWGFKPPTFLNATQEIRPKQVKKFVVDP